MTTITGDKGVWQYVIGLEVHAQVRSATKLFSSASTLFGAEPNSQVELLDVAMPGVLPVLNKFCIDQAVKTGLGLNTKINLLSIFDRKNYFYPDLPQGYQITQFYHPIAQDGWLCINDEQGKLKNIRINRIHLEQDAGKSIHDQSSDSTFLDFNRSGIALMEIVSEPDLTSPYQAAEYVKKLRTILRYLGTCDGDMEKGSFRCDANVSVRLPGESLGTRCEIKNLNSIKYIVKAIEFEAARQVQVLESGGNIDQETRLFDSVTGETRVMRTKEEAHDYRYFHDPDLIPLVITQDFIEEKRKELPELPDDKRERYINKLGLSEYDAEVLTSDIEVSQYFESTASNTNPKLAANWITSELFGLMKKFNTSFQELKVSSENLSELIQFIEQEVISGKIAKVVLIEMFETGKTAKAIIEEKQLKQISDESQISEIIDQILISNKESVNQYLSGKDRLLGFFVGQVMKQTKGSASPNIVNKLLKAKLEKYRIEG